MRKLKNGEVKFKASALKEAARLAGPILPMDVWPKFTTVQVYMGSGWLSGTVVSSNAKACNVYLTRDQRLVCCCDNRNIRRPEK